jgi:Phage tail assembly chaperone proteins, E, or 41 or 14
MNKPKMVREGFVDDDNSPFERETETPTERSVKAVEQTEASPDVPPKPAEEEWPMVIKLRKPLSVGGHQTVTELSLREPSTNDVMNAGGDPCRIEITQLNGNQWQYNPIIDDGKMLRLIANLSGILEPFLKKMDPRDYNTAAYQLRRFFLPEGKLW